MFNVAVIVLHYAAQCATRGVHISISTADEIILIQFYVAFCVVYLSWFCKSNKSGRT